MYLRGNGCLRSNLSAVFCVIRSSADPFYRYRKSVSNGEIVFGEIRSDISVGCSYLLVV